MYHVVEHLPRGAPCKQSIIYLPVLWLYVSALACLLDLYITAPCGIKAMNQPRGDPFLGAVLLKACAFASTLRQQQLSAIPLQLRWKIYGAQATQDVHVENRMKRNETGAGDSSLSSHVSACAQAFFDLALPAGRFLFLVLGFAF
jgi:hypothetical protein